MYTVTPKRIRKDKMVCSQCGSENVVVHAEVMWDFVRQKWVFSEFMDIDDWCHECQCECRVEDVPIFEDPPKWTET